MMCTRLLQLSCAGSAFLFIGACADDSSGQPDVGLQITNLGSPTLHRALAYGDLDGDGRGDWVRGDSSPRPGMDQGPGLVEVWYGSFRKDQPHETWDPASLGFGGPLADTLDFGTAVAIGDFNADGHDDVAIGAPGDTVSGSKDAGSVHILYGMPDGLAANSTSFSSQGSDGLGMPEVNDAFGTAIASGDFDCDGYADLAIGVPGERGATPSSAGSVEILFGGAAGLASTASQVLDGDRFPTTESVEAVGYFGSFLAAGNIDGDASGANACDDLAVGIPGATALDSSHIAQPAAGSVAVVYGSPAGLIRRDPAVWHQGSLGLPEENERDDGFGRGVWLLDHNSDGYWDLLAYSPGDDTLFFVFGSREGLTPHGASSSGPAGTAKGWLRNACIFACELAWTIAPPGPVCDCSVCEYLPAAPPSPCPNCG